MVMNWISYNFLKLFCITKFVAFDDNFSYHELEWHPWSGNVHGLLPANARKDSSIHWQRDSSCSLDHQLFSCFGIPDHCKQCVEHVTHAPNWKRIIRCNHHACICNNGSGRQCSTSIKEGTLFMRCRISQNELLHFLRSSCAVAAPNSSVSAARSS